MSRRSYEDSCRELLGRGWIDEVRPMPARPPRHDDEVLGLSFFRTMLADADLSSMTLPRTFFGRSEIRRVSFRDTDLNESTLCWNDFIEVDFTAARLAKADLRAARFDTVTFAMADLRDTDLRHASFEKCDFTGADLRDALATNEQRAMLNLSSSQTGTVSWHDEAGDEPGGG